MGFIWTLVITITIQQFVSWNVWRQQGDCWDLERECDEYKMQGCDADYSEHPIRIGRTTVWMRCTCDTSWCAGQAGLPMNDLLLLSELDETNSIDGLSGSSAGGEL